jgi:hypothetical protein
MSFTPAGSAPAPSAPSEASAAASPLAAGRPRRPKVYAGIGSRRAPKDILELFEEVAYQLGLRGFSCRSGGADGCDDAFERGARRALAQGKGALELYLPWPGFNGRQSAHARPPQKAFDIAAGLHPGWPRLGSGPQKLMARNAQQILGADLDWPASFVLCWTPDGCASAAERTRETGGTGQAIAHASGLGIPVYNAQRPDHLERIHAFLSLQAVSEAAAAAGAPAQAGGSLRL